VDTLYSVRFREVSGLSSFNFFNQTTGCGDIAYCLVGYFILSHPVENGWRFTYTFKAAIVRQSHFVSIAAVGRQRLIASSLHT